MATVALVLVLLGAGVAWTGEAQASEQPQTDSKPPETTPVLPKDAAGLFSTDRAVILDYLKTHRVPKEIFVGYHGVDSHSAEPMINEVKRAADIFVSGDSEMRVAVAKALDSFFDEAPRMWEACSACDYEARLYLVRGLASANEGKRAKEASIWLIQNANPNFATPILRALCDDSLFYGYVNEAQHFGYINDAKEQRQMLELLRKLYKQGGNVQFSPPNNEMGLPGDSGPAAKYVIRALGFLQIPEAIDQLRQWIVVDGKKVDLSVRQEMWCTLYTFYQKRLLRIELLRDLARQDEIVEVWAITPFPEKTDNRLITLGKLVLSKNDKELQANFKKTILRQLSNPDIEVVKGVAEYIVAEYEDSEMPDEIAKVSLTTILKMRAKKLLEKAFSEFKVGYEFKAIGVIIPKNKEEILKKNNETFAKYREEVLRKFE
jgi:hypothetical protein